MQIKPITHKSRPAIEQLLMAIPFYKAIKQQDTGQFEIIIDHSCVGEFAAGDVVLRHGEDASWLFFLLKGTLNVVIGNEKDVKVVNHITPGEVFGDVAMLVNNQRTATVQVPEGSRTTTVTIATNFEIFGPLHQLHPIKLATKLTYFRNTVHNLRWKLEMYRQRFPDDPLANRHRQIKVYSGVRDSLEELQSLFDQACALANLLSEWNVQFGMGASQQYPHPENLVNAVS